VLGKNLEASRRERRAIVPGVAATLVTYDTSDLAGQRLLDDQ
jgi:hypothetical protein